TVNSQQSTVNSQQSTVNSQQSTVNSHRKQMLAQLSRLVQGLEQSPVLEWVRKQRICSSFYSQLIYSRFHVDEVQQSSDRSL
ncbi:hypothetical protein QUB56_18205, partial [Microcoleus sp. AR_TQ3_B6]|uniref:hypothetical protein n=1 Tax=Microcoleus sp. AR_TQ3_B6 TaxID=3055284 RepID=UPI002FD5E918